MGSCHWCRSWAGTPTLHDKLDDALPFLCLLAVPLVVAEGRRNQRKHQELAS